MSEPITVARPYAEAIFSIAHLGNCIDDWSLMLAQLVAIVQHTEVAAFVANPEVNAEQKVQIISTIVAKEIAKNQKGLRAFPELNEFLSLLSHNRRLPLLPEIAVLFEQRKAHLQGIQDAVIFSAFDMGSKELAALQPKLERHFQSRLHLEVRVDRDLIGGIKVVMGDRVLDTSVRGQLNAMATALQN